MRLLIIRHGDPDYERDSLTEKGWREAKLLADYLEKETIDACYVSPLGRAKDTASIYLQRTGKTAKEMPWLREFHAPVQGEGEEQPHIPWDMLPEQWTKNPMFYHKDHWSKTALMESGHVAEENQRVAEGLDSVLKNHGYERQGNLYHASKPNEKTIVFFCHFGVECVLLGHLLGISPVVLWHGLCALPSSVTTLVTEERTEGNAYFRMHSFGSTTHLYIGNEEPAFAARFCEVYSDFTKRH